MISTIQRCLSSSPIKRALLSAQFDLPAANTKPTKYGGTYTCTLIKGDGVGPEIAASVKQILSAINVPVEFEEYDISSKATNKEYNTALDSIRRHKVALKGILFTPINKYGSRSFNVTMRQDLDLYGAVSLVRSLPNIPSIYEKVDVAIIRENTEGEYSGLEHQPTPDVVEALKIVSHRKVERIAKFAFDFALRNNRKKVTCVHKANIMKLGDGLFLKVCRDVSKLYESHGIEFNDMIVDNAAMQLVSKPTQFDVIVTGNFYGNICSNVGGALVGGPGMVPGACIGTEYAVFEPGCRHVGQDIQGMDKANPSALIMSACMMLRHLNLDLYAYRIEHALRITLENQNSRTKDLGGNLGTAAFTKCVIENIDK
eukprot:NODE_981_length_2556_cov_0.212861.p1 type:complete len:371 gc:universal NODE_981_length_2556_cov_0.212861:1586-474(-)